MGKVSKISILGKGAIFSRRFAITEFRDRDRFHEFVKDALKRTNQINQELSWMILKFRLQLEE